MRVPTKPNVHCPLVAGVMRTLVAVTVPAESALPCAFTHNPTLNDFEVVARCVLILVLASTDTVRLVVDELFGPNCRAATTIELPDTEVTLPATKEPVPEKPPVVPVGNERGAPDGNERGAPDGNVPGPCPPARAGPPHCPFTGALIITSVAVSGDEFEVAPAEAATTQSPALTAVSATETGWVNFVVAVHLTATCPVCGFCTCIVVAAMAAILPSVPGRLVRAVLPPGTTVPAAGDAPDLSPEEPPHAASVTTAATNAAPMATRRYLGSGAVISIRCPFELFAAQRVDG